MLTIDSQTYNDFDRITRFELMERMEEYRNPEGKRFAICVHHAFDLLMIVLYLRDRGGSALLIHGSTPVESALEMAANADCRHLVYGKWSKILSLNASDKAYSPSLLQYTSGTTGQPKLIARTWSRIMQEILQYNALFGDSPIERPIIVVPVSHSFGLITGVLSALAREVAPIIVQDKNPKFQMNVIRSTERPILYAVPFLYHVMSSLDRNQLKVHKIVFSGSSLSDDLLVKAKHNTDEIWQQYGCSEIGCISVAKNPLSITDVGSPLAHLQVSIEADDNITSVDQRGEIVIISEDDAIATRDLGYVDLQTGRLNLLGRIDDVINVSGLKVIPYEVESVIGRLPGVKESVVFRTRHKIWGEAVKAVVVGGPDLNLQQIRTWCIAQLPSFKVPSVIEMSDQIERTPSGKVNRKAYMTNGDD